MLSSSERYRLMACIDVLKSGIEGRSTGEGLELKTQLWLAEKLKEINDELECNCVGLSHKNTCPLWELPI